METRQHSCAECRDRLRLFGSIPYNSANNAPASNSRSGEAGPPARPPLRAMRGGVVCAPRGCLAQAGMEGPARAVAELALSCTPRNLSLGFGAGPAAPAAPAAQQRRTPPHLHTHTSKFVTPPVRVCVCGVASCRCRVATHLLLRHTSKTSTSASLSIWWCLLGFCGLWCCL